MKYNDRCGERLDTELRFIMDTFPTINIASKNRPKPKRKGSSPNSQPPFLRGYVSFRECNKFINLQGGSLPLFTCHCFFSGYGVEGHLLESFWSATSKFNYTFSLIRRQQKEFRDVNCQAKTGSFHYRYINLWLTWTLGEYDIQISISIFFDFTFSKEEYWGWYMSSQDVELDQTKTPAWQVFLKRNVE